MENKIKIFLYVYGSRPGPLYLNYGLCRVLFFTETCSFVTFLISDPSSMLHPNQPNLCFYHHFLHFFPNKFDFIMYCNNLTKNFYHKSMFPNKYVKMFKR